MWTWTSAANTIPLLDGRLNEQKARVDVLTKVVLEATDDMLFSGMGQEDLRYLLLALKRERRIFKTLLADSGT